jgi:hypothetical protein
VSYRLRQAAGQATICQLMHLIYLSLWCIWPATLLVIASVLLLLLLLLLLLILSLRPCHDRNTPLKHLDGQCCALFLAASAPAKEGMRRQRAARWWLQCAVGHCYQGQQHICTTKTQCSQQANIMTLRGRHQQDMHMAAPAACISCPCCCRKHTNLCPDCGQPRARQQGPWLLSLRTWLFVCRRLAFSPWIRLSPFSVLPGVCEVHTNVSAVAGAAQGVRGWHTAQSASTPSPTFRLAWLVPCRAVQCMTRGILCPLVSPELQRLLVCWMPTHVQLASPTTSSPCSRTGPHHPGQVTECACPWHHLWSGSVLAAVALAAAEPATSDQAGCCSSDGMAEACTQSNMPSGTLWRLTCGHAQPWQAAVHLCPMPALWRAVAVAHTGHDTPFFKLCRSIEGRGWRPGPRGGCCRITQLADWHAAWVSLRGVCVGIHV